MKELKTDELLKQVETKDMSVIFFGACSWCGSCRQIKPKFEEQENNNPELKFFEFDIDCDLGIAEMYNINELPVIIAFKNGKEVSRWQDGSGDISSWLKFIQW